MVFVPRPIPSDDVEPDEAPPMTPKQRPRRSPPTKNASSSTPLINAPKNVEPVSDTSRRLVEYFVVVSSVPRFSTPPPPRPGAAVNPNPRKTSSGDLPEGVPATPKPSESKNNASSERIRALSQDLLSELPVLSELPGTVTPKVAARARTRSVHLGPVLEPDSVATPGQPGSSDQPQQSSKKVQLLRKAWLSRDDSADKSDIDGEDTEDDDANTVSSTDGNGSPATNRRGPLTHLRNLRNFASAQPVDSGATTPSSSTDDNTASSRNIPRPFNRFRNFAAGVSGNKTSILNENKSATPTGNPQEEETSKPTNLLNREEPDLSQSSSSLNGAEVIRPSSQQNNSIQNIRIPDSSNNSQSSSSAAGASVQPGTEVSFKPLITARYPPEDHTDEPLNPMVTHFCHPHTDVIYVTEEYRMPRIHHFVLTNDKGKKNYGTCLTVYEEYIPEKGVEHLFFEVEDPENKFQSHPDLTDDGNVEVTFGPPKRPTLYLPRVLCLLSTWNYLTAFREYLTQLYRLATTTNLMKAPVERYVLNICSEIPAPPPGAFEIRIDILNSLIRFWAPPANQPIAWVSLPFATLFECLDVENVLFTWYALALEQKVLLVSSQYSILTVCSEILCSLLFPMQWSHLYIPILPRFLSPMLDAPMPYLCGISRDNLPYAIGDISDETIVVDLDQNLVTVGPNSPEMPSMPYRMRQKIERALEDNAGQVFWNARGLTREKVKKMKERMPEQEVDGILEEADALWREKLSNYDFAFNLAYTPNSPNLLNDNENANVAAAASGKSKRNLLGGLNLSVEPNGQSRWDKVQEAFLRFYVTILRGYRKFLVRPDKMGETDQEHTAKKNRPRWNEQCTFRMEDFLETRAVDLHGFLNELCSTQQFSDFITKRLYYPGEPDVIFFDQSIDAKRNRSKLQMRKTETPFLQSAQAHKVLNTVHAIEPNAEDVPSLEKQAPYVDAGSDDNTLGKYMYTTWPAELNPELYGTPRPIPKIINAEFDRRSALSAQLRAISIRDDFDDEDEYWELYAADCSASPEVAAFTLFTNAYTAMTGIDLIKFEKKRQQMGMGIIRSPGDQNSQSSLTAADPESLFANLDFSYNPYSKQQEELKGAVDDQQNGGMSTDYEEMRAVAKAQLDLAFETLKMIKKRGLRADPDSYKCLIEACGRCGNVRRATQLMEIIRSEHLIADAEMYSYFMQAFSSWNPSVSPTGENSNELEAAMARLPDQFAPGNTSGPQTPGKSFPPSHNYWNFLNGTNGSEQDASFAFEKMHASAKGTFTPSSNNTSDAGSISETASSLSDENAKNASLSSLPKGSFKKKGRPSSLKGSIRNLGQSRTGSLVVTLQKKKDLVVTEAVRKQVNLGETILEFLYSDIQIDTSSDACPKCSRCLKEDDIIRGWKPREFRDYTTACPQCTHRFVPRFSVRCSSASFEGSQGKGTPLYCEYLSPWVMRKEMRSLIDGEGGIETILDPEWRSGTGISATLWWNMVVCFLRYRLPITFLLEANFPNNRLIMPTPESDT